MGKTKWYAKLLCSVMALALMAGLSLVLATPVSAGDLTDVSATSDNSTAGATANYTIAFTTATTGNITDIDMAFATEFDVSGVTLGEVSEIGSGNITVADNVTVTYTVDVPAEVSANVSVSIGLNNIKNPGVSGSYIIAITTKDNLGIEIDSGTASVTINPGPIEHFLVVTEHAGTEVAGTAFSVNITAKDQYVNTVTAYIGDHTIGFLSNATAAPKGTEPTIPASENITFTDGVGTSLENFTLTNAGEQPTITATEGTISGISKPITVNPALHAAYTVVPDGLTQTAGTPFTVTITAVDEFENTVPDIDITLNTYTFTFSGPANRPDGTPPTYPSTPPAGFLSSVWSPYVTLVRAETVALTVSDNQTEPMIGISANITVLKPLAPSVWGPPLAYYYIETNLFDTEARFRISDEGEMLETVKATSEDEMLSLTIPKGTIALDKDGKRLKSLQAAVDESPPDPSEDTHIIGLAYDFGPGGATFDLPITLTWTYDPDTLPEDVAEEDLVIAYYDEDAGEWVECECTCDPAANCVTGCVCHFTTFAIIGVVTPPPLPVPAAFLVSNLSVRPMEVQPEETVTIAVLLANTGGMEGSYTVVLKINGVKEIEKSVTVAAGESQVISFSMAKEDAGTYSVLVDGLSGSFTVVVPVPPVPALPAPPTPPVPEVPEEVPVPAPAPINWPLVGGIIAAILVLAGLLIFFLVVRRRAY